MGSNPINHKLKSPFSLVVRTLPFHGKNTGSIPVKDININVLGEITQLVRVLACHAKGRGFESRFSRYFIKYNYVF
jgi:hypothetical protein